MCRMLSVQSAALQHRVIVAALDAAQMSSNHAGHSDSIHPHIYCQRGNNPAKYQLQQNANNSSNMQIHLRRRAAEKEGQQTKRISTANADAGSHCTDTQSGDPHGAAVVATGWRTFIVLASPAIQQYPNTISLVPAARGIACACVQQLHPCNTWMSHGRQKQSP